MVIDRGDAYPRDSWSARVVSFVPACMNSLILCSHNCSFRVSCSINYTKYTKEYIKLFFECKCILKKVSFLEILFYFSLWNMFLQMFPE